MSSGGLSLGLVIFVLMSLWLKISDRDNSDDLFADTRAPASIEIDAELESEIEEASF